MTTKLYDIDASRARVAHVKRTVTRQREYILTLPPDGRAAAQKNLTTLEDMLDISEKTHLLIMEVLLAQSTLPSADEKHPAQLH